MITCNPDLVAEAKRERERDKFRINKLEAQLAAAREENKRLRELLIREYRVGRSVVSTKDTRAAAEAAIDAALKAKGGGA